jgi:hypothetical protein
MPLTEIAAAVGEAGTYRLYAALGQHVRRGALRRLNKGLYLATPLPKAPPSAKTTSAPRASTRVKATTDTKPSPRVSKKTGSPAVAKPGPIAKAALEFLRRHPGQAVAAAAIAKVLGTHEGSVRSALLRAEARGEVTRESGRFRMAVPPARSTQPVLGDAAEGETEDRATVVTAPEALLAGLEQEADGLARNVHRLRREERKDEDCLAPASRPPQAYVIRRERPRDAASSAS